MSNLSAMLTVWEADQLREHFSDRRSLWHAADNPPGMYVRMDIDSPLYGVMVGPNGADGKGLASIQAVPLGLSREHASDSFFKTLYGFTSYGIRQRIETLLRDAGIANPAVLAVSISSITECDNDVVSIPSNEQGYAHELLYHLSIGGWFKLRRCGDMICASASLRSGEGYSSALLTGHMRFQDGRDPRDFFGSI